MASGLTVTRFAPRPTGYLHLGHVRSALEGWGAARGDGGRFLLRFEDIDKTRCRDEYAAAIIEDLLWLGLSWDGPVRKQTEHFDDYRRAPDGVEAMAVLYPCICTRREIRDEIARTVVGRTRNQDRPIRGHAVTSTRNNASGSSAVGSIVHCGSISLARSL
jgi:glutamyl-Q tRNA(Asp) synthetase